MEQNLLNPCIDYNQIKSNDEYLFCDIFFVLSIKAYKSDLWPLG